MHNLLAALHSCLRPLARVLLTCGIGYREFAEVAKLAFVQEAIARQKGEKRPSVNVSRLAVQTGLSRKELARMRDMVTHHEGIATPTAEALRYVSLSARVMQLWYTDPRFVDKYGNPMALQMDGPANSFSSLVKLSGADIPAGAVRAELLAAAVAEESADGSLIAKSRHFIPATTREEVMLGLSQFAFPVLAGLANNLTQRDEPFVQRVAYTQRLSDEAGQIFRKFARLRSIDFVETIDDWLTAKEIPPEADVPADSPVRLVGVFYFEGKIPTPGVQTDLKDPAS
jgi:hypothetical protein